MDSPLHRNLYREMARHGINAKSKYSRIKATKEEIPFITVEDGYTAWHFPVSLIQRITSTHSHSRINEVMRGEFYRYERWNTSTNGKTKVGYYYGPPLSTS